MIKNKTPSPVQVSMKHYFFAGALLALCLLLQPAQGATNIVVNTADSGDGSLRAVLASANAGDTVIFADDLAGQTIQLTSASLPVKQNVTIDATALAGGIQID